MMRRRTAAIALLLAVAVGAAILRVDTPDPQAEPVSALCREADSDRNAGSLSDPDWRTNPKVFIAHGGGSIDGAIVTASAEAVAASISRGYRMIELDLQLTTDCYLVAANDWKSFRQRTGRESEHGGA